MGVINITPNSFSDRHFGVNELKNRLLELSQNQVPIWDIGAQSTAPMNRPICYREEIQRLEKYFLSLADLIPKGIIISLDSYWVETMKWFVEKFESKASLWLNDISGKTDESLIELLKTHQNLKLIYCHNLAPTREKSSHHMDYIYEGEGIMTHLKEYFQKALDHFNQIGLADRVLLDPCFGFSKNRGDNLILMNNLEDLLQHFKDQSWVIGISKKSFLRTQKDNQLEGDLKFKNAELIHQEKLKSWSNELRDYDLIYRVHDTKILPSFL